MSDNITTKKISLTERIRQITSAAILVGGLLIGGPAQATVTRQSSVVDRAVAVQDALKEKMKTDVNATQELPRAQVLTAQWGNWGNWANWNNWVNWNNWNNWHNWLNTYWGNF